MPTPFQQFLMLSDGSGCPSELFNGLRTMNNLGRASLCGPGVFSVESTDAGCPGLGYQPTVPPALLDAVLWFDASDSGNNQETVRNRGTGGSVLDGTMGLATASSTDQPQWLGGTEKYLYIPGAVNNFASLPNTASLQVSGDIDIMVRVALDDWTPAAAGTFIHKRVPAAQGYSFAYNITTGTISLVVVTGGVQITPSSTVAPPGVDGKPLWIRVTRVAATGVVTFYWAADNPNIPTAWTQLGNAVASTAGNIDVGTQAMRIGADSGGTTPALGKFYRVIVRAAINPSTPVNVLDVDFTTVANTLAAQTSFVATAGGTVTINRATAGRKSVMYMGQPLWLFGTDDLINIPDNSLLDFAANESFTVMAVQRVHSNPAAAQIIASKGGAISAGSVGWWLSNGTTGFNQFQIGDGVVLPTAQSAAKTLSALTVATGVRNVTSDLLSAFLNSAAGTTTDSTTTSVANTSPFRIGSSATPDRFLDAEIMAVLVWRRALTSAEVAEVSAFYTSTPTLAGRSWTTLDVSAITTSPWYDSRDVASGEALGFWIEEWTGLDGAANTVAISPTGQNRGGAYYGPQSANQRVMAMNVLVLGSSERGVNYLFQWLQSQLLRCCNCDGYTDAWIRLVCPSDPVNAPEEGVVRAHRVQLLEGPTYQSPPIENLGCYMRRVSLQIGAGDPCLYREPAPLVVVDSTTTAASALSTTIGSCGTFAASTKRAIAPLVGPPGYGLRAPIVTFTSPTGSATNATPTTIQTELPIMRIAGYLDPRATGDPCRAQLVGELIIGSVGSSGLEIRVDMAERRIYYRQIGSDGTWLDGSRFRARAIRSGLQQWWSFGPCDSGFVVVEPAYPNSDTFSGRSGSVIGSQTLAWTTSISYGDRLGCC